jgi:transposase
VKCRERAGREASLSAAIIDSQSVKAGENGGPIDPHRYDAGKKIKGKKRHILADTQGLLLHAIVDAADIQDRDGGALLVATLFGMFPFLSKLYADGGYQGPQFQRAVGKILRQVNIEIVKRSDQAKGFVVLPKRWIPACSGTSRTLAGLNRCRRLAKDCENLNRRKALAFLRLASIRLMLRKLQPCMNVPGQTLSVCQGRKRPNREHQTLSGE